MKRALAFLVLAALFVLPAPATARVIGIYIAPRFLAGSQDTGEVSGPGYGIKQFSQTVAGGALAVGYNFAPRFDIPVRVEFEYALRGGSDSGSKAGANAGEIWRSQYTMQIMTGFLNVYYDIRTGTPFTPYVGAGLGGAGNSYTFKGSVLSTSTWRQVDYKLDDTTSALAWNLGAGLSWAFGEHFALDLGYRYIAAGYHEIKGTFSDGEKYKISLNPFIHEAYLGARITF
jgi:opacity protein-like surface antigen